jgi:hypothetical protein
MKVKIYLRYIKHDGKPSLALYDSEGNGGIDHLKTVAKQGSTVYWLLDCKSNIKDVLDVYAKDKEAGWELIRNEPKKNVICRGFKVHIPKDAPAGTIDYGIIVKLCNGEEFPVDPMLVIPPPPD